MTHRFANPIEHPGLDPDQFEMRCDGADAVLREGSKDGVRRVARVKMKHVCIPFIVRAACSRVHGTRYRDARPDIDAVAAHNPESD
ncbi:hypothetical protein [Burkholderia sp. AU32262]|uniref:hypothetical protein n=1 Tax=Burkholderia sp. AU32262 TaxID=2879630 RepID=UPI001CF57DA5|nr:hypothetical protein [Burkholderia sp. AU32262]MCA8240296.1 hypothetical protein [Burkholderia sp. AU32262]